MKDVETQTQNVQNYISAKDVNAALADVKKLQDEFKLVEGYFEKRGNAADAVALSKEYEEKVAALQKALEASDFDGRRYSRRRLFQTVSRCLPR